MFLLRQTLIKKMLQVALTVLHVTIVSTCLAKKKLRKLKNDSSVRTPEVVDLKRVAI